MSGCESGGLYGDSMGGVRNQITMSGTNKLHGSVYEFHVIPGLAANTYFNKRTNPVQTLPPQKFDQYGLTIGGPVFIPKLFDGRNKVFFFFGYESLPDSNPSTKTNTVPTVADNNADSTPLIHLTFPHTHLA